MSDIEKFQYVPTSLIANPPESEGPYMLLLHRFWEARFGCLLFYRGMSPQCNTNESIVERMADKNGNYVIYLPRAYIPLDSNGDYYIKDLLEKADIDKKRAKTLEGSDA